MAGFGNIFRRLTDDVFKYRLEPRVANVWNRTSGRTAHLFDKLKTTETSHGTNTEQAAATEATSPAGAEKAPGVQEAAKNEEPEAKMQSGSCDGSEGGCADVTV